MESSGIFIIYYDGKNYLMLIDSGPLQFNIWQQQDSASVIDHLTAVYFSQCLLTKLLIDNDTAFCSKLLRDILNEWMAHIVSLHVCPLGQCDRKLTLEHQVNCRKEVVHNIMPKNDILSSPVPNNMIHCY